jgi:formamidopyrimidine-DNA glycosylase
MPELPEVETVVRDLTPLLIGRTVLDVETGKRKLRRAWKSSWTKQIINSKITSLTRRGKWIACTLQHNKPSDKTASATVSEKWESVILLHLGMTGQLTVHNENEERQDHTHIIFKLDQRKEWRFRDVRRFGSADYFATVEEFQLFLEDKLGPEPFDMKTEDFQKRVQSSARCLKAILLDQNVIAGVGNIYADEACFISGLLPSKTGKSTTVQECERLLQAIVNVLNQAINGRGSTIKDYIGGSGLMGTYQGEFRVYGRTDEACYLCGSKIEMVRLAGRSSHFCPKCQR